MAHNTNIRPSRRHGGCKNGRIFMDLQKILDEIKKENDKVIIMGDWNARIGRDMKI